MKRKKIIIIVAVLLALLLAGGAVWFFWNKKDKANDPPAAYEMAGEAIPAIQVEQEDVTVSAEELQPEQENASSQKEEMAQSQPSKDKAQASGAVLSSTVYLYENLDNPWEILNGYIQQMTEESQGFCFVDDALTKVETPETIAEDAAFTIAKNAAQEGQVVQLQVTWGEQSCVVVASVREGSIIEPVEEKPLTYMEAKDYLCSLAPKSLHLPGASMSEYVVYVQDGSVLVNGEPCIRMKAYSNSKDTATNEIAGQYFLSVNGKNLYCISENSDSNRVERIENVPTASGGHWSF